MVKKKVGILAVVLLSLVVVAVGIFGYANTKNAEAGKAATSKLQEMSFRSKEKSLKNVVAELNKDGINTAADLTSEKAKGFVDDVVNKVNNKKEALALKDGEVQVTLEELAELIIEASDNQ